MLSSYKRPVLAALTVLPVFLTPAVTQTFSTCNPLTQGGCPANPALARSVSVDFTSGASSEFTSAGSVSYDSNGAAFTVSQSGDSPSIASTWYIMFGHADFVIKAAPGTGIVSAAVLQSDCLDEIDWEWLGGDNEQAQSNYFGKGIVTNYNRGAFHGAPGNHDQFHTYSIDWTADQIVWSVDGTTVRVLSASDADPGQYPQTPMYVKLGAWAGGDPRNPQGTIEWAGGVTDFSAGPFTMYVQSIAVTDYSTGTSYSYSGTSGTWESIVAAGGSINSRGTGTPVSAGDAPAVTSTVPNSAPLAFDNGDDDASVYATRTGWPWSGTATATAVTATQSTPALQSPVSSPVQSLASVSDSAFEVVTSWDERGFLTLVTVDPNAQTAPVSYDEQGFTITPTSTPTTIPDLASQSTGAPLSIIISTEGVASLSGASATIMDSNIPSVTTVNPGLDSSTDAAPASITGSGSSNADGSATGSAASGPGSTVAATATSTGLEASEAVSTASSSLTGVSSSIVPSSSAPGTSSASESDSSTFASESVSTSASASGSSSATASNSATGSSTLATSTRLTDGQTSSSGSSSTASETPPAPNVAVAGRPQDFRVSIILLVLGATLLI